MYASDTLALNDDGSLYDPELMYEVAQAVKRENLIVDTVYAPGSDAVESAMALIEKSRHSYRRAADLRCVDRIHFGVELGAAGEAERLADDRRCTAIARLFAGLNQ